MRKFGFSWSWKRATGISAAKGKISRRIGIPLTRSGRERKVGRLIGFAGLGLLGMGSRRQTASDEPAGETTAGGCCGCFVLGMILLLAAVSVVGWCSRQRSAPAIPRPPEKQNSLETKPKSDAPSPVNDSPAKSPTVRALRTWQDNSGQFRTSARLKSMASGSVHLVKEDGAEITVPIDRLSESDQAYIREQMR